MGYCKFPCCQIQCDSVKFASMGVRIDSVRLTNARNRKGHTVFKAAQHAEVSIATISRAERGERMRLSMVDKLAKYAGVPRREFIIEEAEQRVAKGKRTA